ncbi:MAG: ABC transporter ATP-binding protein [Chloroflexi bacterium]|nr:ABC transporter ATP-binding protein [Chloroflexota bacterium]
MPLIETHALTKQYPRVLALDALDIHVEPGVIGLVGANGAGKSTLIKILLGLLPATRGAAHVLGMDVNTQGREIRSIVGYMPEHDCLPPDLSATEFVTHLAEVSGLPRTAARERTAETLRHVGLFEERYREMGGYSTGMKQRVKLAQALVHDPRLIFLDEPTNGLDPAGREEMLDLVRRTGREFGIAVLMSSHLLGEIERVCDWLVVIDGGRLVRSGAVAEFTAGLGSLEVEIEGDAGALADALTERGFEARGEGFIAHVALNGVDPYDAIRDCIVEMEMGLVRLEQRRQSLEDIFRPEEPEAVAERV